jgi:Cu-Zn family superoxide dismutase
MKKTAIALSALFVLAGCASAKLPMAMAMLNPTAGGLTARGMVHFQELKDGSVEVQVDLKAVPPGEHGFHVHEVGDCGDKGNNAKGHFNPATMIHGAREAVSHHAGDFGNVTADAEGNVKTTFTTHSISLKEGASNNPIGRAVILHEKADDLMTQPTGNAGARISCGVVTLMAADMHH